MLRLSLVSILVTLALSHLSAQTDFGSPYSVFGPGTPFQRQTIAQAGMGGSGAALFDLYRQNLLNPAVLAYHADPIFEFGARGSLSTFSTNEGSFDASAFKINNISISFPVIRSTMGLSLGIVPYTHLGYDVTASSADGTTDTPFLANYSGEGGITQAFIGTGVRVFQKVDSANNVTALAAGGKFMFNFGTIENSRRIFFPEDPFALGIKASEKILMRDASLEVGLHFQTNLIKRSVSNPRYLKLLLGAVYDLGGDMNSELSNTVNSFRLIGGSEAPADTINFFDRERGIMTLPSTITFAGALDYVNAKRQRIRLAFDYSIRDWSTYRVTLENSSRGFDFEDSQSIKTGIEFTPSLSSLKFAERVTYRAGFRYEETSLNLRNTRINDYGISFGASIPMHFRRNTTQSSVNFGAEFGRHGTQENGLVQEDYTRFYIGLSLTPNFRNRWFVQQKYD